MNKINKDNTNIIKLVLSKNYLIRLLFFIVACFIYAMNYNTFFSPNKFVVGGMTGLAIVVNSVFNIPTSIFLYASMGILLILAFILLGKESALNTFIGSTVFTFMVTLTEPISKYFIGLIDDKLIIVLVSSLLFGLSNGIIYRSGFNTGGSDVIATLVNKIFKIPVGQSSRIVNMIIIFTGLLTFGITNTIYAVVILVIGSKLVDVVMMGVNDSKMCLIKSKKYEELKNEIINEWHLGLTEINNNSGIFHKKDPMLLVIVPFDLYFGFKQNIKKLDPKAFLVTHDCYSVIGGHKKHIIPF